MFYRNTALEVERGRNCTMSSSTKRKDGIASDSTGYASRHNVSVKKEISWVFLIPMIAAFVFVPLMVRIHIYDPKLTEYAWFTWETERLDAFHYWKNICFSILGGIMLCFTLLLFFIQGGLPKKKMFLPLGIYAIMCILSTFFSVSKYHSIHGFYEMFESIFCLLSYCMICYYAYAVIRSEQRLKTVGVWILVLIVLLGIIGTSQYFNHDIIMSEIGQKLILPPSYKDDYGLAPGGLGLTFGKGRVYATLYNPNYVGVYTAMALPLLLVLTVTVDNIKKLLIYIPLIILTMFSLVGSLSRAGMIAIIGSMILFLVMFHTIIVKYWKQAIGIAIVIIIGIVCFDFARDHVISERFMSIFHNEEEQTKSEQLLTSLELHDTSYTMFYGGHELTIQHQIDESGNIAPIIMEESGRQLPTQVQTTVNEDGQEYGYYVITEEEYAGIVIQPAYSDENLGLQYEIDGYHYFIYYSEQDKTYCFQNSNGKKSEIKTAEKADWKIFKMFGGFSGRGYIWSKSVPLVKHYLLLGSGPDTYTFVYPHDDVIDQNYNGYGNQIITKPHCMYLQTWIQTGGISLLAWLVFYFWYFVDSFRLYFRKEYKTFAEKLGVGLMIATASYMISGIANDSNPSVAPIYWAMLGIGIAANTIVRNTRKEEAEKKIKREQAIAQAKALREKKSVSSN